MPYTAGMPRVGIYCIHTLPRGGMYWVHPCRASSIVSVKINTSLPMMREWVVHPFRPRDYVYFYDFMIYIYDLHFQ